MSVLSLKHHEPFAFDRDWLAKTYVISKDPYRYILSDKDEIKCHHRIKRSIFIFGIPLMYLYKHFRYHQELSRVRQLKFNTIQILEVAPKVVGMILILYPLAYSLFVDRERLKQHQIAKYEIQKFDPDWFVYDEYKYAIHNAPAYEHEDSQWGRNYLSRLPFTYFQVPGWIRRRREQNPNIMNEVPPKYDFTPKGPRAGTDFLEMSKKKLPFLINSNSK